MVKKINRYRVITSPNPFRSRWINLSSGFKKRTKIQKEYLIAIICALYVERDRILFISSYLSYNSIAQYYYVRSEWITPKSVSSEARAQWWNVMDEMRNNKWHKDLFSEHTEIVCEQEYIEYVLSLNTVGTVRSAFAKQCLPSVATLSITILNLSRE